MPIFQGFQSFFIHESAYFHPNRAIFVRAAAWDSLACTLYRGAALMDIRKAAYWAVSSQYLAFIVSFGTSLILARWFISPEQLGIFSIAFAAVSLIAFLQDFGVARYVSGEKDLSDEKLRTAFTLSLCVGWGIAILAVLSAWPITAFYGDPRLFTVTLVISASYFLVPLAIVPQALRQRDLDFRSNSMIELSAAMANAVVSLTLAFMDYGTLALAWGAFAQQAARALVAQWRAGFMLPIPPRIKDPEKVIGFGGTNTVLVTTELVASSAPELLIGRIMGAQEVGLFGRATGLASQLRMLLAGAASNVFFPAFAKIRDRGDPLDAPYLRVTGAYCAITWPAMAGIAVLSEPLVNFLYGPKWIEAAPLLTWIALAQILFVAMPLAIDLPILLDKRPQLIRRNIASLVAGLTLLVASAPFGIEAMAMSRVAHGIVWVMIFAPFLKRIVNFSWASLCAVQAKTFLATLMAVAPSLLLYIWWDVPSETGFMQMAIGATVGIVLWLGTLFLLRHPAAEEIGRVLNALYAIIKRKAASSKQD